MTRETKAGIVVTCAFLGLVGVVLVSKLLEQQPQADSSEPGSQLAYSAPKGSPTTDDGIPGKFPGADDGAFRTVSAPGESPTVVKSPGSEAGQGMKPLYGVGADHKVTPIVKDDKATANAKSVPDAGLTDTHLPASGPTAQKKVDDPFEDDWSHSLTPVDTADKIKKDHSKGDRAGSVGTIKSSQDKGISAAPAPAISDDWGNIPITRPIAPNSTERRAGAQTGSDAKRAKPAAPKIPDDWGSESLDDKKDTKPVPPRTTIESAAKLKPDQGSRTIKDDANSGKKLVLVQPATTLDDISSPLDKKTASKAPARKPVVSAEADLFNDPLPPKNGEEPIAIGKITGISSVGSKNSSDGFSTGRVQSPPAAPAKDPAANQVARANPQSNRFDALTGPPDAPRPSPEHALAPSNAGPRTAPLVESYDEEKYVCRQNDTFRSVSQEYYRSDKYQRALFLFNRDHPLAQEELKQDPPLLRPGVAVYIPPTRILEKYYSAAITEPGPAGETSTLSRKPAVEEGVISATEKTYRVADNSGEMFLQIARRVLGNEDRWVELYKLNPQFDPKYPIPSGTELRLPVKRADKTP